MHRLKTLAVFLALSAFWAAGAAAQPAHLVKDIDPSTRPGGVAAGNPAGFGNNVYFPASSLASTEQLWESDGMPGGTRKLRDFDVVGTRGPSNFSATDSALYFFADRALWSVGPTTAVERVADLPGEYGQLAALPQIVVFFIFVDGSYQLWRSDGTEAGTARIDALSANTSFLGGLTSAKDVVYFLAWTSSLELWKTDGTESGTVRVVALDPLYSGVGPATVLGNLVVFVTQESGDSPRPFVVYRSDGTAAGTFPIGRFAPVFSGICPLLCPPGGPSFLTAAVGQVFMAASDGDHGQELWRTDGTVEGTRMVKDIFPGPNYGVASQPIVTVGPNAYFTANDGVHGPEIWISDGTETGTRLTADLFSGDVNPSAVATLDDRALFLGSDLNDLWVTDGTESGTLRLRNLDDPSSSFNSFTSLPGETLFFQSVDAGSVLWKTDGTPSGTSIVEPFEAADGSYPDQLTDLSGRFMFATADGPFPGSFRHLWSSDGTAEGTRLIREFNGMGPVAEFRGSLFFSGTEGENEYALWKSDGTHDGTVLVRAFPNGPPRGLVPAGHNLFFAAFTPENGSELWATDGTEAGTRLVSDVRPGPDSADPLILGALGERIVFMANDGVHGQELWASDGTTEGTNLLRDILPGDIGCSFQDSTVALGRVFFGAYDGTSFGLWSTDGTADGTYSLGPFDPHALTTAGHLIYFRDYGFSKLWRSDGTTEGTFVVREGFQPLNLIGSTGLLYFTAGDSDHGVELWRSDGTAAGTRMVKDILPGVGQGAFELVTVGQLVVFSGHDGEHGVELWSSDGSEAGTRMIQDIAPGAPSSSPTNFTLSGGSVFFSADDGVHGQELWSIPLQALVPVHERGVQPIARPAAPARVISPRD